MKILIVSGTTLNKGYGIERFIETLVTNQTFDKIEFYIIYPYFKKNEIFSLNKSNIYYVPIFVPIPTNWPGGRSMQILFFNLIVFFHIASNRLKYDIVHTNGEKGGLGLLAKKHGTVFTIHGYALDSFRNSKSSLKFLQRFMTLNWSLYASLVEKISYLLSAAPVQIGEFSGSRFRDWLPTKEVTQIQNGVKSANIVPGARKEIIKKYGIKENCFIALWIGGDPERKGLMDAIKAVEDKDNVILFIVGYKSTDLTGNNLKILGRVSKYELDELYSSADFLIFPSKYEALPFVVLEAISYGIPVIGLKKPYMEDIFGPEYSLLCGNSKELSEKVKEICSENDKTLIDIRKSVKEISLKFTSSKMAKEYLELYNKLINSKV